MDETDLQIELEAKETPERSGLTLEAVLLLTHVLKERLFDYKTTIGEDVRLLQDKTLPKRRRLAVEVRLAEKEIIAAALETLQHQDANMQPDEDTTNGYQDVQQKIDRTVGSNRRRKT